jgi:hypothetical protein
VAAARYSHCVQVSLLIYESQGGFAARNDPVAQDAYWAGTMQYLAALRAAGVLLGGTGLEPPSTAQRVVFQGGKPQIQDGPYADTKEQLGGLFMLEVGSWEEALRWAERFPPRPGVIVEVRPNMPGERGQPA